MSATDNHTEELSEIVFGSRTIFVPGRTVEIGYSVRKKSSFPIVEELILKLLNAVGRASLTDIVEFVNLPSKYLTKAFQPILSKGLVLKSGDDFQLSAIGKMLFSRSENDVPTITESESMVNRFTIDDVCALPIESLSFNEHQEIANANLKWFIEDLHLVPNAGDDLLDRTRRNFGKHFAHFMQKEKDIERFRQEQLDLHKTEYANTKRSFPIRVDIHGVIQRNGLVVNHVYPLDTSTAKTESRMSLRGSLIEAATTQTDAGGIDEIRFLRDCFGNDFIDNEEILCAVEKNGVLPWFKIMPIFFSKNRHAMQFSDRMVIGELCSPRNIELIKTIFERVISSREFTPESPLKISWLRPSVDSWGRSIAFLDSVNELKRFALELFNGEVKIELWENRYVPNKKIQDRLKAYRPWFDDVRVFRSPEIPSMMEIILIDEHSGIAVTHAFSPPQACFPCPIGVAFESNKMVRKLLLEKITPEIHSLPKPAKRTKKMIRKSANSKF